MPAMARVLAFSLVAVCSALTPPSTVPGFSDGGFFHLQTSSLAPIYHDLPAKDRLFLTTYHTGAGLSDPTFTINSQVASKFRLNDTVLEIDLGNSIFGSLEMGVASGYYGWEPIKVKAGASTPGFYFNNSDGSGYSGLRWNALYPQNPPGLANPHIGWWGTYLLRCD